MRFDLSFIVLWNKTKIQFLTHFIFAFEKIDPKDHLYHLPPPLALNSLLSPTASEGVHLFLVSTPTVTISGSSLSLGSFLSSSSSYSTLVGPQEILEYLQGGPKYVIPWFETLLSALSFPG